MRSIRFFIFFVIAFTAVSSANTSTWSTTGSSTESTTDRATTTVISLRNLSNWNISEKVTKWTIEFDSRRRRPLPTVYPVAHKHPDFSKQHLFVPAIVVVCIAFAACAIFDIAILICRHHSKKREHKRDMENFEIFGAYAKRLQASTESKMRSNSSDAADTGKKSPKKEPLKDDGKKQPKDDRKKEPLKDGGKKSLNKELLKEDGKKDVIMI
ncbi:hypothetical protein QR680_018403 [Steinernema hermaphroditum]|uniref:Uncharacterized protein n=1 Tax=Steinernema hermaphroditum TaxID=289476 RepID=A0AA39HHV8_9BILA|nr:hypothetical protein QR680_018403 [Steinernema hermaphroditum]